MRDGGDTKLDKLATRLQQIRRGTAVDIPAPERLNWVEDVGRWLYVCPDDPRVREVILWLSEDPEWEVRRAIADTLMDMPDDLFREVVSRLVFDRHSRVADSAREALQRRKLSERPRQKKTLEERLRQIRLAHGREAERAAREYAELFAGEALLTFAERVRTFLTPILARARALLDRRGIGKYTRESVEVINRSGSSMVRLSRAVDTFADRIELELRRENLADLIPEASRRARSRIIEQGEDPSQVEVIADVRGDDVVITASREYLGMALTNLIQNAIESYRRPAGFTEGRVYGRAWREGAETVIVVEDRGGGLSEYELSLLREFLPRASSKPHGTGYGLPIALKYVQAHGGTLTIASAGYDQGTIATIRLPGSGTRDVSEGDQITRPRQRNRRRSA